MCSSPVHIHHSANGKVAYDAPCGHCEECQQNARNDMFVRSWQEYTDCDQNVVFTTLTYREADLPKVLVSPEYPVYHDDGSFAFTIPAKYVSAWNREHIKTFIKALKEKVLYTIGTEVYHLQRLITLNGRRVINPQWKSKVYPIVPFRYELVTERGETDVYIDDNGRQRFGTHRPHYHILFYLPHRLITESKFLDLINNTWQYGRIYNEKVNRTVYQMFDYLLKYLHKDRQDPTFSAIGTDPVDFRNHKPFNSCSRYFGLSLLDGSEEQIDFLDIHGCSIPSSTGGRVVNLPRYYSRRFTHNEEKTKELLYGIELKRYVCQKKNPFEFFCPTTPEPDTNYIYSPFCISYCDIDYSDKALEVIKCKSSLTPFGVKLDQRHSKQRAEIYAKLLAKCQTNNGYASKYLDSNDVNFINDVSVSGLEDYLLHDHYIKFDQYHPHFRTIYTNAYYKLRTLLNHVKDEKRQEREYQSILNLQAARSKAPHLFNKSPHG